MMATALGRSLEWVRPIWNLVNSVPFMLSCFRWLLLAGLLIFGFLWMQPHPVYQVTILSIEPANRTIDRQREDHLVVTRRVCASRSASVRVIRTWVTADGGVLPTVDDWAWVDPGCHDRPPVLVYPPVMLPPGVVKYRVALEHCPRVRTCEQFHLEDIEVRLVNERSPSWPMPQTHRF